MKPSFILLLAILFVGQPTAATAPIARAPAVIRRELADAQTRLARLEAELLQAEGVTTRPLTVGTMRLGQVGFFNDGSPIDPTARTPLHLYRRLGPQEALMGVAVKSGTIPRVVARGIPAADLATGSIIRKPDLWRVVGTRDLGDETLFVIEPYP